MGIYADRGYTLQDAKNAFGLEIESWYGGATLDTFDCSVLGSMYRYECNEAAQLRMLNGKVGNNPVTLRAGQITNPNEDPVWGWIAHSAVEAGKVHDRYLTFQENAATQYASLKAQLAAATTVAQIDTMFEALWG